MIRDKQDVGDVACTATAEKSPTIRHLFFTIHHFVFGKHDLFQPTPSPVTLSLYDFNSKFA